RHGQRQRAALSSVAERAAGGTYIRRGNHDSVFRFVDLLGCAPQYETRVDGPQEVTFMPAITPLQHDIQGLTGRNVGIIQSRNVSYSSWTTLVEVNINPAEECDLLIIGHISVRQSGQVAREARVTVRVM